MNVEFSVAFKRQLKRLSKKYRNIKDDVQPVIEQLISGQLCGNRIVGVECALYKVRVANSDRNKGKSGGYRVIYYLQTDSRCILVTIYSKVDQSDIQAKELISIIKELDGT